MSNHVTLLSEFFLILSHQSFLFIFEGGVGCWYYCKYSRGQIPIFVLFNLIILSYLLSQFKIMVCQVAPKDAYAKQVEVILGDVTVVITGGPRRLIVAVAAYYVASCTAHQQQPSTPATRRAVAGRRE
jgi:hypothetical protein